MSWNRLLRDAVDAPGVALAAGELGGKSAVNRFGLNADVDTGTVPETVWGGGGAYAWQAAAAFSLEILSSSTNDASAGTGARTVTVVGLDATWAEQTQTVTLNGTTVVALTGTWLRVNSVTVATTGSGGTNAGTLTLRLASAGATQAVVQIGYGRSDMAIYTVPLGKTAYVRAWRAGGGTGTRVRLRARDNAGSGGFQVIDEIVTPGSVDRAIPIAFTEKTDIELTVASVAADNTVVNATMELVLVD